ncbi:MAG: lipoate protein ligase C-terminal domain-containing protein [Candidatus Woesearchaeota archaeon]
MAKITRNIIKKVSNGKLVRISIVLEDDIIQSISITGDFFLHPENTISMIEESLKGRKVSEVNSIITNVLSENNAIMIGCSPNNIHDMIGDLI